MNLTAPVVDFTVVGGFADMNESTGEYSAAIANSFSGNTIILNKKIDYYGYFAGRTVNAPFLSCYYSADSVIKINEETQTPQESEIGKAIPADQLLSSAFLKDTLFFDEELGDMGSGYPTLK